MKRSGIQVRATEKECARCGETFHPWTTTQKYCSHSCGSRQPRLSQRRRRILVCVVCGTEFEAKASEIGRGRKYCSRECWRADPPKRSAEATARLAANLRKGRRGRNNPGYKHGERAGARDRQGERRFKSGQEVCQHPDCHGDSRVLNEHHVVYEQHVRAQGGDRWDGRNALRLCNGCHSSHHRRGRVLPVSALRDENFEFAAELLGAAAYDYFRRYYVGTDERLEALLEVEVA